MCLNMNPKMMNAVAWRPPAPLRSATLPKRLVSPRACSEAAADQAFADVNLPCDSCNGRGWLVCDFCNGQKTNVQVRKNRFYRRCPSCKAVGAVLCSRCKVFRCVTFPDGADEKLV